jgi:hypothetical protein
MIGRLILPIANATIGGASLIFFPTFGMVRDFAVVACFYYLPWLNGGITKRAHFFTISPSSICLDRLTTLWTKFHVCSRCNFRATKRTKQITSSVHELIYFMIGHIQPLDRDLATSHASCLKQLPAHRWLLGNSNKNRETVN